MAFADDFKTFIKRGNVVDLAVGVIIGAAFGKIVTSLVTDILMPPIGMVTNGLDFSKAKYVLKEGVGKTPETSINYGAFFTNVIDFIIVAFVIFLVVKAINSMHKKEEVAPAPAPVPEPTKEEVLLTEIRDLLAKGRN